MRMQVDGILLDNVQFTSIQPIYLEEISKSKLNKLVRILNAGDSLTSYMILEKDPVENFYWLVGGYPEYLAYKSLMNNKKTSSYIPCIIRNYTDTTEQRITLLKRMFHHQVTKWMDKHQIIAELIDQNKSTKTIANKLGISEFLVKSYFIHPDIPKDIIQLAKKNHGSFINLEKIRRLPLSSCIQYNLFKQAVLKTRHPNRLTTDKLEKIKWLIQLDDFFELAIDAQWKLIQKAMKYKDLLKHYWRNDIERILDKNRENLSSNLALYNATIFINDSTVSNFVS